MNKDSVKKYPRYTPDYCDRVREIANETNINSLYKLAEALGISNTTIHIWCTRHPDFNQAVTESGVGEHRRDTRESAFHIRLRSAVQQYLGENSALKHHARVLDRRIDQAVEKLIVFHELTPKKWESMEREKKAQLIADVFQETSQNSVDRLSAGRDCFGSYQGL